MHLTREDSILLFSCFHVLRYGDLVIRWAPVWLESGELRGKGKEGGRRKERPRGGLDRDLARLWIRIRTQIGWRYGYG